MKICTMTEYSSLYLRHAVYPSVPGNFSGTLLNAHWAPHSIIHTIWEVDNGMVWDCCLFPNNQRKYLFDPEKFPVGTHAILMLVRASSGKVYLRGVSIT